MTDEKSDARQEPRPSEPRTVEQCAQEVLANCAARFVNPERWASRVGISEQEVINNQICNAAKIIESYTTPVAPAPVLRSPQAVLELTGEADTTTAVTANILRHWPREKIERFAKHLLGDAAQSAAILRTEEPRREEEYIPRSWERELP